MAVVGFLSVVVVVVVVGYPRPWLSRRDVDRKRHSPSVGSQRRRRMAQRKTTARYSRACCESCTGMMGMMGMDSCLGMF